MRVAMGRVLEHLTPVAITVAEPDIPILQDRQTQIRFHFYMDKCIGCHACEVACSEQNGLPVDTQWRRVGEVQSGTYPDTRHFFLSSGCNHCLEPSCLLGCPVNAYEKNNKGIVLHLDDVCIGCGYCTWNCPYGVPVFQKDRKIVTKCDLCVHRLEDQRMPACVEACPVGAIQIEEVDVETIRQTTLTEGVGPDMPTPEITLPTTKITLPKGMTVEDFQKVNRGVLKPEEPHTPLIILTVLSQLGFGGFLVVFIVDLLRTLGAGAERIGNALGWVSPALLVVVGLSLNVSILHLGRPAYAMRAVRNWKTSWLSREIIGLSAFATAALLYSLILFFTEGLQWISMASLGGNGMRLGLGGLTVVFGVVGIYCSSMLYRVPARPAWNSIKTTIDFFEVALILGPAFYTVAVSIAVLIHRDNTQWLGLTLRWAALVSILAYMIKNMKNAYYIRHWRQGDVYELYASARLRLEHFWRFRFVRNLLGGLSMMLLLMVGLQISRGGTLLIQATIALLLLTIVSFMNRYLFFVTVVPRNIPGNLMTAFYDETEGSLA